MEFKKYQKIEINTTCTEDTEIEKVINLLTDLACTMEGNDCEYIHARYFDWEQDYHISQLNSVIEFLKDIQSIDEIS